MIVCSGAAIANRGLIRRQRRTRPPLGHQKRGTKVLDSFTPGRRRHHFFGGLCEHGPLELRLPQELLQLGLFVL